MFINDILIKWGQVMRNNNEYRAEKKPLKLDIN